MLAACALVAAAAIHMPAGWGLLLVLAFMVSSGIGSAYIINRWFERRWAKEREATR